MAIAHRPIAYLPRIIEFLGYDPYASTQTIPEQLRAVRRALGMSQRNLAARLGVDPATVARWESGERTPHGKWLEIVDRFLDDSVRSANHHAILA